jgi:hypothetical protein
MDVVKGGTLSGTTTVVAEVSSVASDRASFDLPNHTAKEPRVIIFTRKLPGAGNEGHLRLGIKVVAGDRNTDGTARSGNVIGEATFNIPQDQDDSVVEEVLETLYAVLRDPDIMDDMLAAGRIPYA